MDTSWHEARSITVPETGCWLWLGAEKGNGYGNVRAGDRNTPAHRHAYELLHGALPRGIDVCHKCDTRSCINPDHLFAGSRADNMTDARKKGRLASGRQQSLRICGEKAGNAKLSVGQVVAIRTAAENGAKPNELAAIAKVCVSNIHRILRNNTWKEIDQCAA